MLVLQALRPPHSSPFLVLLDAAALALPRAAPPLQRFCGDNPARCIRPSPPAAAQDMRSRPRLQTARQRKAFGDRTGWRRRRSVPQQSNAWTRPHPLGVGQKNSTRHPTGTPLAEMVNPSRPLGQVRNSPGNQTEGDYCACALIPASLMIGHHLSISAFWKPARPSAVCCSREATSSPNSVKRARTAGSARACTIALLSVARTSFGVPLGAKNPNHPDI